MRDSSDLRDLLDLPLREARFDAELARYVRGIHRFYGDASASERLALGFAEYFITTCRFCDFLIAHVAYLQRCSALAERERLVLTARSLSVTIHEMELLRRAAVRNVREIARICA